MSVSGCAVQPQVTGRILRLLQTAGDALRQAEYEGSHTLRHDPEPREGTPWNAPDLPVDVARDLSALIGSLNALYQTACDDYERANKIVHMRYADTEV